MPEPRRKVSWVCLFALHSHPVTFQERNFSPGRHQITHRGNAALWSSQLSASAPADLLKTTHVRKAPLISTQVPCRWPFLCPVTIYGLYMSGCLRRGQLQRRNEGTSSRLSSQGRSGKNKQLIGFTIGLGNGKRVKRGRGWGRAENHRGNSLQFWAV